MVLRRLAALAACALVPATGDARAGVLLCHAGDGRTATVTPAAARAFALSLSQCSAARDEAAPAVDRPDKTLEAADDRPAVVVTVIVAPPARAAAAPPPPSRVWPFIERASRQTGVDASLLAALIYVESAYDPAARSRAGAIGLMQLMPATARRYGIDRPEQLLEPATNVLVGARYLGDLLALFDGRPELALAAYNAGEAAVARHGYRVPPYAETQDFVRRVLAHWQR